MNRVRVLALVALVGGWIFVSSMAQPAPQDDPRFAAMTEEFIYQTLAFSPVTATGQGLHHRRIGGRLVSFDTELDDFSSESIRRQIDYYSRFKQRLSALQRSSLSPEQTIDYRILTDACDATLLELEKIQSYRHNPTVYVELIGNSLFGPIMLEYAPKQVRAGHVLARMEKLWRLVEQAEENLETTDPVYTKVALEENQGNIGMIKRDIAQLAEADTKVKRQYAAAAPRAITVLEDFSKFIRDDLPKRGSRSWRLGPELYDRKFKYVLETDLTPGQLLKIAEDRIPVIYDRMFELAEPIYRKELPHQEYANIADPHDLRMATIKEVLDLIARDHTTRDNYMAAVQKNLNASTRCVQEKHIITLPA
jgi:uncharacterized protein (DUF885 family)